MIVLNWDDYLSKIHSLCNQIKCSPVDFNFIYGIPRGGLIPATIISHELNIPLIDTLQHAKKDDIILIVDDISDTGETFKAINSKYDSIFYFGTLFLRYSSSFKPDFYEKKIMTDDWLVFPYEKMPQNEQKEIKNHIIKKNG